MVVKSEGTLLGTVGGGCGEAEVYELAQEMLTGQSQESAYLFHVDLTEGVESGDKVCGGRFDVLLQRLDPLLHAQLAASARAILRSGGQLSWQTSIGQSRPGFWKRGALKVPVQARLELGQGSSEGPFWSVAEDGQNRFEEPMGQALRLVIVGAGHIARPLSRLATEVGYRVLILDDRPEYARKELFPDAFEVVVGQYEQELPRLADAPATSVVLVTRGHRHDQDCLRLLLRCGVPHFELDYLGMIGSQRRIDAVFAELVEEGIPLEALRAVHAPVGLEIGARTPAEIAVSILAQMIRVRRLPGANSRSPEDRKRHQRTLHTGRV